MKEQMYDLGKLTETEIEFLAYFHTETAAGVGLGCGFSDIDRAKERLSLIRSVYPNHELLADMARHVIGGVEEAESTIN